MGEKKNIFVVGLDDFNLGLMQQLKNSHGYRFHALIDHSEIVHASRYPVERLLREAKEKLRSFDGSIDAIVGYWDFPTSTILPLLRREFGLPGPTLESVLKCEHKYWSRLEQAGVTPECTPQFAVVDPFADRTQATLDLAYPFWLKPVKSHSSHLGFRIRNAKDLKRALEATREDIFRLAEPFNYILGQARLPAEVTPVSGSCCIAEEIISSGRQCTVEGYVCQGEVVVYGTVDSVRERTHRSSFARYQYPSRWPVRIQQRMAAVIRKVILHIGLDNTPFNVEFFWHSRTDRIWLLEINPRISKSHCPLFEMVDGQSHHKVMIEVALGRKPDYPQRQGRFRCAAKFMLRRFEDACVAGVPSDREVRRLEKQFPGTRIQVLVREGMRLSQLRHQDSYSYEYAVVFMGGDNPRQLLDKYRSCSEALNFRFDG